MTMTDQTTTRATTRRPSTRKAIHGFVSNEAHDAWHTFAVEHGVSVSAMLELIGTELRGDLDGAPNTLHSFSTVLTRVINGGRRLDAANRRRNRRP